MKRNLPSYTAIVIDAKIPDRPLDDTERLVVAMGLHSNPPQWSVQRYWIWSGERRHLKQAEFTRQWAAADLKCLDLQKAVPGTIAIQEQIYSETPFN